MSEVGDLTFDGKLKRLWVGSATALRLEVVNCVSGHVLLGVRVAIPCFYGGVWMNGNPLHVYLTRG